MKSRKIATLLATSALALGAVVVQQAMAAGPPPVAGFTGYAPSSVAGCPYIQWRVARHDDGKITGRFWYSDLSGTSVAVGMVDPAGKFHVQLTNAIGEGPVGTIDGQRSANGQIVADLRGQGCANYHVMRMTPTANVTSTEAGAGG